MPLQWKMQAPLFEISDKMQQKTGGIIFMLSKVWIDGYESEHLIYHSVCSFIPHTVLFISLQAFQGEVKSFLL